MAMPDNTVKSNDSPEPSQHHTGMVSHAKDRSAAVVTKLRIAMAAIELDIDSHGGVYPFNGGRLSRAEVCRRADVKPITLIGPVHKDGIKVEVDEWREWVLSRIAKGKKSVRRAVTDRATAWKDELHKIANQYHLAELRMVGMAARIAELEAENTILRERCGLVVSLHRNDS